MPPPMKANAPEAPNISTAAVIAKIFIMDFFMRIAPFDQSSSVVNFLQMRSGNLAKNLHFLDRIDTDAGTGTRSVLRAARLRGPSTLRSVFRKRLIPSFGPQFCGAGKVGGHGLGNVVISIPAERFQVIPQFFGNGDGLPDLLVPHVRGGIRPA